MPQYYDPLGEGYHVLHYFLCPILINHAINDPIASARSLRVIFSLSSGPFILVFTEFLESLPSYLLMLPPPCHTDNVLIPWYFSERLLRQCLNWPVWLLVYNPTIIPLAIFLDFPFPSRMESSLTISPSQILYNQDSVCNVLPQMLPLYICFPYQIMSNLRKGTLAYSILIPHWLTLYPAIVSAQTMFDKQPNI